MKTFWELSLYFIYMTVATTVIPLPTQPAPLYMGEFYPLTLVAFLGALGAALSHFMEYHIVVAYLNKGKFCFLEQNERILTVKKKVRRHFFWGLLVTGAVGIIPSDLVRILTMLSRYNPLRASLAIFLGRMPRYFFLAYFGEHLHLSPLYIIGLFILLALMGFVQFLKRKGIIQITSVNS